MALDLFNNIFLLDLAFEAAKRALKGFTVLKNYLCQAKITTFRLGPTRLCRVSTIVSHRWIDFTSESLFEGGAQGTCTFGFLLFPAQHCNFAGEAVAPRIPDLRQQPAFSVPACAGGLNPPSSTLLPRPAGY
jgi:hypothetical protein